MPCNALAFYNLDKYKKHTDMRLKYLCLIFSCFIFVSGCSHKEPFRIETLAKSEIDMVADQHLKVANQLLAELLLKLYARNPRELDKTSYSVEYRAQQLFGEYRLLQGTKETRDSKGSDTLLLAVDESFSGDRVFALMYGLTGMIQTSYNNQDEFFITDSLDEQRLYNSARNIEILLWRLQQVDDENNQPLILTNATGPEINLSFERLFGKLIANQDMMAQLIARKNHRVIRSAVHTIGSLIFLPI